MWAMKPEKDTTVEERERLARLEGDVRHMQKDVSEIKVNIRRLDTKVDDIHRDLSARTDDVNKTLSSRIDDVNKTLSFKIDDVNRTLTARIDDVNKTLSAKIDVLSDSMSTSIGELRRENASNFKWLLGAAGCGVLFLTGMMYFLTDRIRTAPEPGPASTATASVPASSQTTDQAH